MDDPRILPTPESLGPYPPRAGNAVTPWIDGVPFYERLAAAFRGARTRVWAIVSFIQPAFRFPDGTKWSDMLGECQARGLDVRVLFWRNPRFFNTAHVFLGGPEDREFLARSAAQWAARWDSSGDDPAHCHHQKAFVVDADEQGALAFVGGMVLSNATLARPGHATGLEKHDAMLELRGPVVIDVAHNFVQRWNLGCADPEAPPWPDDRRAGPLPWPVTAPAGCGEVVVQLCRTITAGLYGIVDGEATILEHYRRAFAAARRTIYIENQHPGEASLLRALAAALARGVRVVMVVPGAPMQAICRASAEVAALGERAEEHRYGAAFATLAALAGHPNFSLVAIARSDPGEPGAWSHREIYNHAKLCIVDGGWMTLGSANFVDLSLHRDHSELNASVWGGVTCLPLLRRLVSEHTGQPTDELDDLAAVDLLARVARASRASLAGGGPVLGGCHAIDAARYGRAPPLAARFTGRLADDTLELRLLECDDRPAYHLAIHLVGGATEVGRIILRLDADPSIALYAGNIAYEIDAAHRGHGYAARACRLLRPVAAFHGVSTLWIVTTPGNLASRRTAELAGGEYVDTHDMPPDTDMFAQGMRQAQRYRWVL